MKRQVRRKQARREWVLAEAKCRDSNPKHRAKSSKPSPIRKRSNPLKMGIFWVMMATAIQSAFGTACDTDPEEHRTQTIPRTGGHMWNLLWDREENVRLTRSAQDEVSGEQKSASEKGKQEPLCVISANVHSRRPRAEIVAAWKADIVAVQETKLAPHAIAETSTPIKG